ncbi:hypothetical protein G7A66_10900 [Altererythrobacter sp. SALINAS58]|nr:hypothetical protein [Alteripontixanthobacter muriae]NTZ43580.1 hypothetical protein [Alteripontixanthobacter muriae]
MLKVAARSKFLVAALLPALAACATAVPQAGRPQGAMRPVVRTPAVRIPPTQPAPSATGFRPARVMNLPGLDGIIGAERSGLLARFGQPRLDVVEGDVRKLQFVGTACVLDVFLYPPAPGAEPRATYVDARRSSDGLDVDRAACAAALQR